MRFTDEILTKFTGERFISRERGQESFNGRLFELDLDVCVKLKYMQLGETILFIVLNFFSLNIIL